MKNFIKITLFFFLLGISSPIIAKGCHHTTKKFKKYIENSTWVVPPQTLLAYLYVDGKNIPASDQTVWVIDQYEKGYFFGNSYTSINQGSLSQRHLSGAVTPLGDVYITFFSVDGSSTNTDIVNGIGRFKKVDGKYVFIMQMNSAQNSLFGLSHWSYMVSVRPGDPFYVNLPGENMSLPQFLSQFN